MVRVWDLAGLEGLGVMERREGVNPSPTTIELPAVGAGLTPAHTTIPTPVVGTGLTPTRTEIQIML